MSWIYLFLIFILWGSGNVLVKRGLSHLSAWQSYALDAVCIAFPIWMVYGIANGGTLFAVTPLAILTGVLISVIYGFNYYVFSKGGVSLAGSIISTYPVVTLVLAYGFLHERLQSVALMGVVLTIIGVIIISFPHKKIRTGAWVYLAILTSLGYGITTYMGKLVLNTMTNASYLMILAVLQVFTVGIWKLLVSDTVPGIHWGKMKYSIVGIILLNIGNIVFYIALQQGLASLVVPLSSTYVLLMVALSVVWLKEKIYGHQLIGIVLSVAGVIFAGLFSGR